VKIQRIVPALLFLGVILGQSFFQTPNAEAVSDNVVIYQVSGAVAGDAAHELILLYNKSLQDINVTNWCIKYSSLSDGSGFKKCIAPPNSITEIWITSGGFVSFASSEFVSTNSGFVPDIAFTAGMNATAGHVRLLDNNAIEIDKIGWGSAKYPEGVAIPAHPAGFVLSRYITSLTIDTDNNLVDFSFKPMHNPIISGLYEQEVIIDLCSNIEGLQTLLPEGFLQDNLGDCYFDVCPNLDDLQKELAEFYYIDDNGNCQLVVLESRELFITELLPNAGGSDTGLEFIEIYNPHAEAIDLTGYRLKVGPNYTKEYVFVSGEIGAGQYASFSDTFTGIVLPNTTGAQIRIVAPAGNVVSESGLYNNAKDNISWAFIEDVWVYTNQVTKGSANKPYLEPAVNEVEGVTSVLAPCPAGKYRNTQTNRCRTIETAVSQLTPCDENEYRNPETNRCRKVASSTSTLKPCEAGEERNPATNRCRKVSVLGISTQADLSEVQDVAVENTSGQINWAVIGIALGSTIAYMLYEWRNEIRQRIFIFKNS